MAKRVKTTEIFIHCSATPGSRDVTAVDIDRWHKKRGWSGIGYHYVIRRDGTVDKGRPTDVVGAHVRGYNMSSVGVCMIGGMTEDMTKAEDNFTNEQWESLETVVGILRRQYHDALVVGHNDVTTKACPSFDVQEWAKSVGFHRTLADTPGPHTPT